MNEQAIRMVLQTNQWDVDACLKEIDQIKAYMAEMATKPGISTLHLADVMESKAHDLRRAFTTLQAAQRVIDAFAFVKKHSE